MVTKTGNLHPRQFARLNDRQASRNIKGFSVNGKARHGALLKDICPHRKRGFSGQNHEDISGKPVIPLWRFNM
jgi:hypothetical protein